MLGGVLAGAVFAASASAGPGESMPGPSPPFGGQRNAVPRGHENPAALNAQCESCHTDIAKEWRGSQHRAAFRDPSFAHAFLREPLPFCQGCHAPEGDASERPTKDVADMGVGCVTCHVVAGSSGKILAAAHGTNAAASAAPHEVVRSAIFATERACAGCHEFAFPDGRAAMQSTVSEHALSTASNVPCAGCHMPMAKGQGDDASPPHRSHAFAASQDPARLRSAADVSVTRTSPTLLHVKLAPRGVGHAFPTGDLFRRLAVYATVRAEGGRPKKEVARFLARHFEVKAGKNGALLRSPTTDDRVGAAGPAPTEIDMQLDAEAAGRVVAWRVTYERIQNFTSMNEHNAVVTESITLFEGELKP